MSEQRDLSNPAPSAKKVKLPELNLNIGSGQNIFNGNLDLIQNVKVKLSVSLGESEITISELFALKEDSVIKLDKLSDAPLEIYLDNKLVGRGNLVVVDDNFGIRITEFGNPGSS